MLVKDTVCGTVCLSTIAAITMNWWVDCLSQPNNYKYWDGKLALKKELDGTCRQHLLPFTKKLASFLVEWWSSNICLLKLKRLTFNKWIQLFSVNLKGCQNENIPNFFFVIFNFFSSLMHPPIECLRMFVLTSIFGRFADYFPCLSLASPPTTKLEAKCEGEGKSDLRWGQTTLEDNYKETFCSQTKGQNNQNQFNGGFLCLCDLLLQRACKILCPIILRLNIHQNWYGGCVSTYPL